MKKVKYLISISIYYLFARYLPASYTPYFGYFSKKVRYYCCKNIFLKCGKNINIERMAEFGGGKEIIIGDNSGLGLFSSIPSNIEIGKDVMMGPFVYIHSMNHNYSNLDLPMNQQGESEKYRTKIEDNVWIGSHVILTPGRIIKEGSIIATGTVLTKDFPVFSIIGGNPGKFIKSRI